MIKPQLAVAVLSLLTFQHAQAENERQLWTAASPDKKFLAAGRSIPDPQLLYRLDLDVQDARDSDLFHAREQTMGREPRYCPD